MTHPVDSTSGDTTTTTSSSPVGGDTPLRARRRQIGHFIAIVGIVALIPMMICAVLVEDWRGLFALLALLSWIIWKIGRTITKMNSPEELH